MKNFILPFVIALLTACQPSGPVKDTSQAALSSESIESVSLTENISTGNATSVPYSSPSVAPIASGKNFSQSVFVGYQGWFRAPGDDCGSTGWRHWFQDADPRPIYEAAKFDLWPNLQEYSTLYPTQLNRINNEQARLFSSCSQQVVDTHFRWMKEYGIDGVAVQRFILKHEDHSMRIVLSKIVSAARKYDRKFYLMYDLSSLNANDVDWRKTILDDWQSIKSEFGLEGNPLYARENGKMVVALWGIGFNDRASRPASASQSVDLIHSFKAQGIHVAGGVPFYWRKGINDSRSDFSTVYQSFDTLIPWAVGRFKNGEVGSMYSSVISDDVKLVRSRGQGYQSVIFPGFSFNNGDKSIPRNQIRRDKGKFFWEQFQNAKKLGIGTFIAMFDEVDEGTAIFKAATTKASVPQNQWFLTLDEDGAGVSSDFYLRLTGIGTEMIVGQRPLTENIPIPSGSPIDSCAVKVTSGDVLKVHHCLFIGNRLASRENGHKLELQNDGNLVLRDELGTSIWATNTVGSQAEFLVMQNDGNLVLYTGAGEAVWASQTSGKQGLNYQFVLQNDRNLVVYSDQTPIWASGTVICDSGNISDTLSVNKCLFPGKQLTSSNKLYSLILQHDGNLVLYNSQKIPVWSSRTNGKRVSKLVMQNDGNLVLYGQKGEAIWASNSARKLSDRYRLILQNDRNLVIYENQTAIWSSKTYQ